MTELSLDEIRRLHAALAATGASGVAAPSGTEQGEQHIFDEHPLDDRVLVAAAATAAELGRHDDALALARAALVANPTSARAWSLAGRALLGKGEDLEARRALETAVSLDDKDLATALLAAGTQVRTGALSAARALASYVILHEQGAPDLRAAAQALLDELDRLDPREQPEQSDQPDEPDQPEQPDAGASGAGPR